MAKPKIQVVPPGHHLHSKVSAAPQRKPQSPSFKYDQLVKDYNSCPEGGLVILDPRIKLQRHQIRMALESRGLKADEDFSLGRPSRYESGGRIPGDKRSWVITKKTSKECLVLG